MTVISFVPLAPVLKLQWLFKPVNSNGTVRFKNVNNGLNTNIYSYLETSGGQSSNLYLNVVHFFQHQS